MKVYCLYLLFNLYDICLYIFAGVCYIAAEFCGSCFYVSFKLLKRNVPVATMEQKDLKKYGVVHPVY